MKKNVVIILLIMNINISFIWANAITELQTRLNKINTLSANFKQKIMDVNGDLIQQGEGNIYIKRPNLFNYHMISPDENLLISDGNNLWFYNPFIEQVTVTLLDDVIKDTLFMIIISNNYQNWKSYYISQINNDFLLVTKQPKSDIKRFSITIQPNGIIQKITITEQDGQVSLYYFKDQNDNPIDNNKFKFTLPNGVTLDDQRPKSIKIN